MGESRLVAKAKAYGAPTASRLVEKAKQYGTARAKEAKPEAKPEAPTPAPVRTAAAPGATAPAGMDAEGRNPLHFFGGAVTLEGAPRMSARASRFKQAPQEPGGDGEKARLQAEIGRLKGELARVKAATEEAEREVRAAREQRVREIEEAAGQRYTAADRGRLLSMTAEQLAAVARFAKHRPAVPRDPRLFHIKPPGAEPENISPLVRKARNFGRR